MSYVAVTFISAGMFIFPTIIKGQLHEHFSP